MTEDQRFSLFLRALDIVNANGYPPAFRWIAEPLIRSKRLEGAARKRRRSALAATLATAVRGAGTAGRTVAPEQSWDRRDPLLVWMPFRRNDYVPLLVPAIRAHIAGGERATILTHRSTWAAWRAAFTSSERTLLTLVPIRQHPIDVMKAYWRADAPESRDRAKTFVQALGLSVDFADAVVDHLAVYWREHLWFSRILGNVRPCAVLGIHFVASPGVRGSLEDYRRGGEKPRIALVQHGVFDHGDCFHDFANADLLAVWGSHWLREVQRFASHPYYSRPTATLTGHPSAAPACGTPDASTRQMASGLPPDCGYALWLHSPETLASVEREILEVLTAPGLPPLRVKPHPREHYQRFVERMRQQHPGKRLDILAPSQPVHEALEGVIFAIGTDSTALLDALRAGVVVGSYAPPASRAPSWVEASIPVLHDASELQTWTQRMTSRQDDSRLERRPVQARNPLLSGPVDQSVDPWAEWIATVTA